MLKLYQHTLRKLRVLIKMRVTRKVITMKKVKAIKMAVLGKRRPLRMLKIDLYCRVQKR